MFDVQKKSQGFTLIELMIVIAIIGILAAVAVPAYQDYIIRTRASEGYVATGEARASIQEYYTVKNKTLPGNNAQAGLDTPGDFKSAYVSTLTVGANGVVTVLLTANDDLGGTGDDYAGSKTIVYSPQTGNEAGKLDWACTGEDGGTLPPKFRPAACR